MKTTRWFPAVLCLIASMGCFHQVVQTGRAPSATVVDKPFVATWLWGLVAAPEIDVRKECPTGVAVVTTETSFVNGLATFVTLGIFAPQHVTITCAMGSASLPSRPTDLRIPANATLEQSREVLDRAAAAATASGQSIVVRFSAQTDNGDVK